MAIKYKTVDLLFNEKINIGSSVDVYIPTVKEAASDDNFSLYTALFTVTTREIFASLRNVDELEMRYPTLWDVMRDEQMDMQLGALFGKEGITLSQLLIDAFAYWTKLESVGDYGFQKLSNGKIMHVGSEWIIDRDEYIEFSGLIKTIINYTPPEHDVPDIPSDDAYNIWLNIYKGRAKSQQRKAMTWADKILILSISMETRIPPETIGEMSVFEFYQLFSGLSKKDAYEVKMAYQVSPKYKGDDQGVKHWKELFKVSTFNNYQNITE